MLRPSVSIVLALLAAVLIGGIARAQSASPGFNDDFESYTANQPLVEQSPRYVPIAGDAQSSGQIVIDQTLKSQVLEHKSDDHHLITRTDDQRIAPLSGVVQGTCDVMPVVGDHCVVWWQDNTNYQHMAAFIAFENNNGSHAILAKGDTGKLIGFFENGKWYRVSVTMTLDSADGSKSRYDAKVNELNAEGTLGKQIGEVKGIKGLGSPTSVRSCQILSSRAKNGRIEARFDNVSFGAPGQVPAAPPKQAAQAPVQAHQLDHELRVAQGTQQSLMLPPLALEAGQRAYLSFDSLIDSTGTDIVGSAFVLSATFNGKTLGSDRLTNKAQNFYMRNGWDSPWYGGGKWRLVYGQSFDHESNNLHEYDVVDAHPFQFVLDVTDVLKPEGNLLVLRNTLPTGLPLAVVTRGIRLEARESMKAVEPTVAFGTVPQGPLPDRRASVRDRVDYQLTTSAEGGFTVTVNGQSYAFSSGFTYPNAGWNYLLAAPGSAGWDATGRPCESGWQPRIEQVDAKTIRISAQGQHYRLQRQLQLLPDRIEVADTLTNTSDADVPVMFRHEARFEGAVQTRKIAGLPVPTEQGQSSFPENPVAYVGGEKSGLAIMRWDDVMRVQGECYIGKPDSQGRRTAGILDRRFCLAAGTTRTLQWSIFPTQGDDYWAAVNRIRRAIGSNFTIPGSFAFYYNGSYFNQMTPEQLQEYVATRGLQFIGTAIGELPGGRYAHGTALPLAGDWIRLTRTMMDAFRQATPQVKTLIYFHCSISTEPGALEKYSSDVCRDAEGNAIYYDYTKATRDYPMFYPTLDNSYGRELQKYFDIAANDLAADGIYWDEMSESNVGWIYGGAWDGVSADINPSDFTITRRTSSVALLIQPFQQMMVDRLAREGRPLVGNSQPFTLTMARYQFPRFVETCPVSTLHKVHLHCPLGLGDAVLTERDEDDVARQIRLHVDRGALYYYYDGRLKLTHPNLTSCMFPFTPVEIRPGVLIGKERIVISVPGRFAFEDGALPGEVRMFDERGRQVDGGSWVQRDENAGVVEVRLPHGYTAALLR